MLGLSLFCRWVRYFWFAQSSLNQKSRAFAVFKCTVIDLAFHVLFKFNPNVITSLCVRSEGDVTRLTVWPLPHHGTDPDGKLRFTRGLALGLCGSSGRMDVATREGRGLPMPLEVMVPCNQLYSHHGMAHGRQPQLLPSSLLPWSLRQVHELLVFVPAFFIRGLEASRLPPGILSRWVSFFNLLKEDTLGRSGWNGSGEMGEIFLAGVEQPKTPWASLDTSTQGSQWPADTDMFEDLFSLEEEHVLPHVLPAFNITGKCWAVCIPLPQIYLIELS